MRNILIGIVCVLLTGCIASTADLTRREPYSQTTGTEQTLKREVLLCRIKDRINREYIVMRIFSKERELHALFDKAGLFDSFYRERVCDGEVMSLPAGTRVRVDKVIGHTSLGGGEIVVLGRVVVPGLGKRVAFQYGWEVDSSNTFKLPRAPWEDETVPVKRDVGFLGLHYREAGSR
jgi:hypothetical protein